MKKVVERIRKHPEIIMYTLKKMKLLNWMSDEKYVSSVYKISFNKKLNLKNPVTFSEKLNWYKLYYKNPLMHKCVDKFEVREYVKEKIGEEYLNELYGVWDKAKDIDIENLPNKFVLKPTNGTGDIVICKDKKKFDLTAAKQKMNMYKNNHFSNFTKEWAYYDVPYRIIAEKYMENSNNELIDYKFFCIHGKPEVLLVCTNRAKKLNKTWFDTEFNKLDIHESEYLPDDNLKKPVNFQKMLEISKKLSEDFPFARVDLYNINGKIYFGEITFYPSGGVEKFEPYEFDLMLGKKWKLE